MVSGKSATRPRKRMLADCSYNRLIINDLEAVSMSRVSDDSEFKYSRTVYAWLAPNVQALNRYANEFESPVLIEMLPFVVCSFLRREAFQGIRLKSVLA